MVKTEKEIRMKIEELGDEISKLRSLLENKFLYEDELCKEEYTVKVYPEEIVIVKHVDLQDVEDIRDISIHRSVLRKIFDWLKELEVL